MTDGMTEKLLKGAHLTISECRDLMKMLGLHMRETLKDYTRVTARNLIRLFIAKYPNSLTINDADGVQRSDGEQEYGNKLYDNVNYRKPAELKQSRKRSGLDQEEVRISCRQQENKADEYGCVAYQVPYPDGESKESQESKRMQLLTLSEENEIDKLMEITYPSQRTDIIDRTANLADVISNWPHLLKPRYLFQHADTLFGRKMKDTCNERISSKGFKLFSIMELEANKGNQVAEDRKQARQRMKSVITQAKLASDELHEKTPLLWSLIELLSEYFLEDPKEIFRVVSVSFP